MLTTSTDPSDDELSELALASGVAIFRGPLDNVAARFIAATNDLGDDDVVIRATADNPVPDNSLVEQMFEDFRITRACYLGMRSYPCMPYGAAVEIFRLGALRKAITIGFDKTTREHVTSRLANKRPIAVPDPTRFDVDVARVRVTVDTLDDYLVVARAFRVFEDAIALPWKSLVECISAIRSQPTNVY